MTKETNNTQSKVSRRSFLQTGFAATGGIIAAPFVSRLSYAQGSPNQRIQGALIGLGGRGGVLNGLVGRKLEGGWAALCDVDRRPNERRDGVLEKNPGVPVFWDYREMFDQLGDSIDAVAIAVPDHSHYHCAMLAMSLGKHVYLEKPMCHRVWEARALAKKAAEMGLATQVGNTGHSNDSTALVRDYVQSGAIGKVHRVIVRNGRTMSADAPATAASVPENLDWNLWLNRTPQREYAEAYDNQNWRNWKYYGSGVIGDWAPHDLDAAAYALKLGAPTRVECKPGDKWPAPNSFPFSNHIIWDFPARGDMPPVRLEYLLGDTRLPDDLDLPEDVKKNVQAALIIGDEGYVTYNHYGANCRLLPLERMRELGKPEQMGPGGNSHTGSWAAAAKGETDEKPLANFEYSAPMAETMLLGNVALRVGRPIEWDSESFTVKDDPEAQALVKGPEAREGWGINQS